MKKILSVVICLLLLFSNIPVTASAVSDTTAPGITLSETEVKPGDIIKFEIEANDKLAGLVNSAANIIVIRNKVDGTQSISLQLNYNEGTEKYELEYTIPANMLKGEWYIEKVVLQDNAENKTYSYTNITFTVDSIVIFNSNGGSEVAGMPVGYNEKAVAPSNPTRTGYTFGGWYKDNTTFANLFDFTNTSIIENIELFANWTINNYTATFNSQGGSAVMSKTADYNSLITEPVVPTNTDYTFGGWYKEAEGINAWNFTTDKVTANTTLYAKWAPKTPVLNVQRLAGINRIETSIAIAKEQYVNSEPDAVVLATANNFADALAGSGLAYKNNAPLLLVNKTVSNSKNVLDYITTNLSKNKNIYILGGTGVVSNEISDYLTAKGYKIIRLGGKNRYETNQEIFDYLNTTKGSSIVIATGDNFADALSISSIADIKGFPILLNSKDNLLASVSNDITNIGPETVYIIGGTAVLSSNIETQIKRLNGKITIVRLGGINRYETSMKILEYFNLNTTTVTVATGIDFPDALSGSVLAARNNCSVLLVDNKNITKQKDLIYKQKITKVIAFGGEGVISNDIATSLIQKPTISTPTSVKAVSSSYNSIDISWSGVTGATLYEIYRATSSAGTYTLISTTTGTKYNNAGLTTNSTYYYKVISYRMVGTVKIYSGFSTAVSAKPLLAPPVNVRATRINSNSIKLTWSGVTGANGYEVYRATTSTGTYSILAETAYLYYTNSGLITGKTYYYKMRSYRKVGTTRIYSNWTAATYKATTTNIVYNNLVQPNAVYGKYQGLKVEILDQYNYVFLIKKSNGIQMWVASTSVSVASNPATNTKYMDKKQLETYVNITSTFVSNTNYFTWVDLNRQRVSVFSGSAGHWVLLKTYSCATGNNATPSKRGLFTVQDKGYSFVAGSGVICKYWTRYSGNYLLHSVLLNTSGSIYDGTVGKRASHGCIRMPLDMAKWYYEKIPKGSLIWVN